jgi:transcriptional regulator with XRE-family HTH domain
MAIEDSGWWFLKTMARKHRTTSGKSQREVGEAVDRSEDTIRAWELGRTDIPLVALEAYSRACGMDTELIGYMKRVAKARKKKQPIEADARLNALFIALAEQYYGYVFKWDPFLIPGPLQTERYHFTMAPKAEPTATPERLANGWGFKSERREGIRARTDEPIFHFLIGEVPMIQLRRESEELYQEELAYLREWASLPGFEIRILTQPVRTGEGNFDIYKPGGSRLGGPPFVYTESHDSSRCIDDPNRFESYDVFRTTKWKLAIGIEDYGDDHRSDRLA